MNRIWLGEKCPRDHCNGDLYVEMFFKKEYARCFLCCREFELNGNSLKKPWAFADFEPLMKGIK